MSLLRTHRRIIGPLAATLVVVGAACRLAGASEGLCAYRNDGGALVWTNEPTKDGLCASAGAAPRIEPASPQAVLRYDNQIRTWSSRYGVSPRLVRAVIATESAYNSGAVSSKGARGLMQLMPETAKTYGVSNSFDADENIRGGVAHLRNLLDLFGGDTRLAVAAYNAGENAVRKYSGVPPFTETRQYVASVLSKLRGRAAGLTRAASPPPTAPVRMRVDPTGTITLVN